MTAAKWGETMPTLPAQMRQRLENLDFCLFKRESRLVIKVNEITKLKKLLLVVS